MDNFRSNEIRRCYPAREAMRPASANTLLLRTCSKQWALFSVLLFCDHGQASSVVLCVLSSSHLLSVSPLEVIQNAYPEPPFSTSVVPAAEGSWLRCTIIHLVLLAEKTKWTTDRRSWTWQNNHRASVKYTYHNAENVRYFVWRILFPKSLINLFTKPQLSSHTALFMFMTIWGFSKQPFSKEPLFPCALSPQYNSLISFYKMVYLPSEWHSWSQSNWNVIISSTWRGTAGF